MEKRTRIKMDWGTMSSMEKAEVLAFFMDIPGGSVSGSNVKVGQIALTGVQGRTIMRYMAEYGITSCNDLVRSLLADVATRLPAASDTSDTSDDGRTYSDNAPAKIDGREAGA